MTASTESLSAFDISLPTEIWGEIFSHLTANDYPTYWSLSLVSKAMHATVQSYMYQDLPFLPPPTSREAASILLAPGAVPGIANSSIPRSILLLRTLTRRPELRRHVQSFCIQRFAYLGNPFDYRAATQPTATLEEVNDSTESGTNEDSTETALPSTDPSQPEPFSNSNRADVYYKCLAEVLSGMTRLRDFTISTEDVGFYLASFALCLEEFINNAQEDVDTAPENATSAPILLNLATEVKPDLLYLFRQTLDLQWTPELPGSNALVIDIVDFVTTCLESNGFPESQLRRVSSLLESIHSTAPLVNLTVKDPFTPETYLDKFRHQASGLKSLVLHGTFGNILRPRAEAMSSQDKDIAYRGGIIVDSYLPEDWPQLQRFQGCIEDLLCILPQRQHLRDVTIVESERLMDIGDIEHFLIHRARRGCPGLLNEVCDGLSKITRWEIVAAEPHGGVFRFEDVSNFQVVSGSQSHPRPARMFLQALQLVQTLVLPPLTVRNQISLANIANLSTLTHLFIGANTFETPLLQSGTNCPCKWQRRNRSRPAWSLMPTVEDEQEVIGDITTLFTKHPILQRVVLITYVCFDTAATNAVSPHCAACEHWRKAEYSWSRDKI